MADPTVPCETCGQPTDYLGTRRCTGCHEVESRLAAYLRTGGAKARAFVWGALADTAEVLPRTFVPMPSPTTSMDDAAYYRRRTEELEKAAQTKRDAERREAEGPRCALCNARRAIYGKYCGSCMSDMDL